MWSLQYEGQTLAVWRRLAAWAPHYGSILAVPYNGKLRLFRAIGQVGDVVTLDLV